MPYPPSQNIIMSKERYILLDRDGVINYDSDDFIKSPEEWLPIEGSLEAIALFNARGYKVIVVTNQSGIGRGLFDEPMLNKIHAKMQRLVNEKGGNITAIYYCPHSPNNNCDCRKPKPGLLKTFAFDFLSETISSISSCGSFFRFSLMRVISWIRNPV